MTAKRRSLASFEATSVLFFALLAGGALQAQAQTPSAPRGTSTTPSTTSTTSTRTSQITPAEAPSQAKSADKPEAPKM